MPTRAESYAGLSVALVTPFHDGQVDVETLKRQVEFQIEAGVNCICPVGTTGESPTLSHAEHERVIAVVVEAAAGRIKVMPGTGFEQHQRSTASYAMGGQNRRRCSPGRCTVLQQTDSGGFLSALQDACRGGRDSDLRL